MSVAAQDFPWTKELEKTLMNSLATSFGLDFLLFKDQKGGEVDTIHNVRNGVWATDTERKRYDQREAYSSKAYHEHANYKSAGQQDGVRQTSGTLYDPYRNTMMGVNEKRNLDHVISAKEIHDDAGRELAGLSGVDLANQSSNLQSTHESVNKSKKQASIDNYLRRLPDLITTHESTLVRDRERLAGLKRETPEHQHRIRVLEDKIRKTENKITELKAVDSEAMRRRDAEARGAYEQQINRTYYSSSKFLHQTAKAAGMAGIAMGTRQMLGVVLAEIWFELREQLPALLNELKQNFRLETFINSINKSLKGIWKRVQERFSYFLRVFKDGVFAGVFGSLTTTLFNIFVTTHEMAIKIIRELWGQLIKFIKLMVFNPDQLSFTELCQRIVSLLSIGVGTVVGSIAYTQLLPICSFPFGAELAAFASTFITGILTLGLNYFLLYSKIARKVWKCINSFMPHVETVKEFQAVNAELDRYLTELSLLEFNLDADELQAFTLDLKACNDEIQRNLVLKKVIRERGIELPFEMGDLGSTRNWLASLL